MERTVTCLQRIQRIVGYVIKRRTFCASLCAESPALYMRFIYVSRAAVLHVPTRLDVHCPWFTGSSFGALSRGSKAPEILGQRSRESGSWLKSAADGVCCSRAAVSSRLFLPVCGVNVLNRAAVGVMDVQQMGTCGRDSQPVGKLQRRFNGVWRNKGDVRRRSRDAVFQAAASLITKTASI
ncbi:6-pyruvoyl tetrahydrobiopterin synthase [Clarias magur]|uniref:6-pyruvoyl tetrahydrobiopterin synthase n=1 Tax=Clarias magur TaxID=1594786 RepID=A0A8J4WT77_CLAMG|nr:6-pyruvoyl tetrahydrobiopterin synthase [Clarias magur]